MQAGSNARDEFALMPGAVELIGAWLATTIGKTRIEAFSDGVIATIITTCSCRCPIPKSSSIRHCQPDRLQP